MALNSNQSWHKAYYILLVILLVALMQPSGGTWAFIHDIRWLYVFLVSFIITQLLTPIVIKLAFYFKILDYPDARKIHGHPIPRLGGLAIVASILIATARNLQFSPQLLGLTVGCALIYLIGLIDDVHPLPATPRFIAQIVICLMIIKSDVVLTVFPQTWLFAKYVNVALTLLWFVGIANAINFLDGVDGLATGMIALCALLFFSIAWPTRQSYLSYITIATAGACIGFLPYNWRPAKVFLGDAGATFLGFLIAGLAVMGSWAHKDPAVALSTPLLILGIPIFDMIYITVSRIKNDLVHNVKEWLEYTGRDHFHHRLMHLGLSQVQTVLFIWMLNLCLGLGALVIRDTGIRGSMLLLIQSVIIFVIVIVLMILGKDATNKPDIKWKSTDIY